MDYSYLIISILFFCAIAFVISSAEVSIYMANQLKLELIKNDDSFQGKFWKYFENKQVFLMSLLSLGKLTALVFSSFLVLNLFEKLIWTDGYLKHPFLFVLTGLTFGIILIVLNEILPILFIPSRAEKVLKYLTVPLTILIVAFYLPTKVFIFFFDLIGKKRRGLPSRKMKRWYTLSIIHAKRNPEDIKEEDTELQILQNAIDFSNIRARDCMVPRTEIISVDVEEDINVLKNIFIDRGISKILIYRNSEENIIGYVHSFEMFKNPTAITQVLHPISFVPSAIPGKELLEMFAKQSGNISVVVDEYGGTAGIVTIEDVIEEIFGEIEDEHDKEDWLEEQISEHEFRFSARADIDYLNETYKFHLPESDSYETLAGLIFHELEEIPEVGRKIDLEEYTLLVEEVSDRRIEVVKVIILEDE